MNRWLAAFVLPLVVASSMRAQTVRVAVDATLPTFEVASVKPADPKAQVSRYSTRPGQFLVENVPLSDVVAMAFGVPPSRMTGAPDWVARERFSIQARMPEGAALSDQPLMIRALLMGRFKLRYRVDKREGDGYELTVLEQGGRFGPQLRVVESKSDCAARFLAGEPMAPECRFQAGPDNIEISGFPIAALADALAGQLGSVVEDRTGLLGSVELKVRWSRQSVGALSATNLPESTSLGPALFTALEEQLGLRLKRTRLPIEYVVIENIERPEPD